MAAINLVKIKKVEYADADLVAGVAPTVFTETSAIKDGAFTLNLPEATSTPTYGEQTQQVIYVRKAPVLNTATMELATEPGASLASLSGNTFDTDTLTIGGTSSPTHKYLVITGENSDGLEMVVTCPNTFVTYSWTGTMGANQELVGWMFTFNMLEDKSAEKVVCSIKAVPAA